MIPATHTARMIVAPTLSPAVCVSELLSPKAVMIRHPTARPAPYTAAAISHDRRLAFRPM